MSFQDKVARDPRVVFAAALNRHGLLAHNTVGSSMGQVVIFNDVAADVGRLGGDSLDFYYDGNEISRMESLSHSFERKRVGKHKNAALLCSGYAALVSTFPGKTWVEWSCVGLATAFAGIVLKKHNGFNKEAFEQACSIQIRQSNRLILANEIVRRREVDVQELVADVFGKGNSPSSNTPNPI